MQSPKSLQLMIQRIIVQHRSSHISKLMGLFVLTLLAGLFLQHSPNRVYAATPLVPYVYAAASSNTSYDVMVSDGASKDRRVARVKVDSVYFSTVSARLSADATTAAFRVSGDRLGGSSIYSVDLRTGKYSQIASSRTGAEAIGSYVWSPAGNTLAFVRSAPAGDTAAVDESYGTVYIFSVGFKATKLGGSHGSDRVISFSGDGLGVYVSRLEQAGGVTLQNLVYLPLSGEDGRMVLHSQPGLQYSNFALWAPAGVPGRIACLAEGSFSLAASTASIDSRPPGSTDAPTEQSKVPTSGKLTRPNGLGLVVYDMYDSAPLLLRRDAEAFQFLGWKPDGTGLLMGGTRSGATWTVDMAGNRRTISTSLRDMNAAAWSPDSNTFVLSDMPTTRLVSVSYTGGGTIVTRYVSATAKASAAAVRLPVPYIHQVKDTVENGNGTWACGPTSVAMSLAYFGKLEPWTVQAAGDRLTSQAGAGSEATPSSGTPLPAISPSLVLTPQGTPKPVTGADFAPYITNKYTAFGHTYSAAARDPSGNTLMGLYGTICPTGLASWQQMAAVLSWHGLNSQYVSVTWDGIVGALRRGHPVLLGNMLTSEGHIILVIGYTADGNLIVNDPYGNRFQPGYGSNSGSGVLYPWKLVTPRHAMEIIGSTPAH